MLLLSTVERAVRPFRTVGCYSRRNGQHQKSRWTVQIPPILTRYYRGCASDGNEDGGGEIVGSRGWERGISPPRHQSRGPRCSLSQHVRPDPSGKALAPESWPNCGTHPCPSCVSSCLLSTDNFTRYTLLNHPTSIFFNN